MSVLNKMLKDLEQRHGQAPKAPGVPAGVHVLAQTPHQAPRTRFILASGAALIASAFAVYHWARSPSPAPLVVAPKAITQPVASIGNASPASAAPSPAPQKKTIAHTLKTKPDLPKAPAQALAATPAKSAPATSPAPVQKNVSPDQNAEYQYQLALESIQQDHDNEAIPLLKNALRLNPHHEEARRLLATVLVNEKRHAEAEQFLSDTQNITPISLDLIMMLARLQVERGDNAAALQTLLRNSRYASQSGDYLAFEASLYQRQGDHTGAKGCLTRALQLEPGNGKWRLALASSLQALGQEQQARQNAQAALNSGGLSRELQALAQQIIDTSAP